MAIVRVLAREAHRACTDYDSGWFPLIAASLLCAEAALGAAIIRRVPYTEIDWEAYMDEVGTILSGDFDYTHARGGTGPLVYPGGFVLVYSALYNLTGGGVDIRLAQYIFLLAYLTTLALALDVYRQARVAPPWTVVLLCLSKRVHSIYMLRLFNDGITTLLLYAALSQLSRDRWAIGCSLYSLAVSVKMHPLLCAPALFVLLWKRGGARFAAQHVGLCAAIQLTIGAPYLVTNARGYISRSFELGRVFLYKWTVNLRFLPEAVFVSKRLAAALLAGNALTLLALGHWRWCRREGGLPALLATRAGAQHAQRLSAREVVHTMLVANFVGIVFARTLHYQFYSWYFHALPHLLWSLPIPTASRLLLFAAIESAWNVYPPAAVTSLALLGCHIGILAGLSWGAPSAAPTQHTL